MKERPIDDATAVSVRERPGSDVTHRDAPRVMRQKRRDTLTLGLRAFEQISAIEGIRLTPEMREDLKSLDSRHMDGAARSRFIAEKYGKP